MEHNWSKKYEERRKQKEEEEKAAIVRQKMEEAVKWAAWQKGETIKLADEFDEIHKRVDDLWVTIHYLDKYPLDISRKQITETQQARIELVFDTYIELADISRELHQLSGRAADELMRLAKNEVLSQKEVTVKKVRVEDSMPACKAIEKLWSYYYDQVKDPDEMWEICAPYVRLVDERRKARNRALRK